MTRDYRYRDFDVLVQSRTGGYSVRVLESPAGQTAAVPSALPFDDKDLRIFLLELGHARSTPMRGPLANKAPLAREFGGKLFDSLFVGEVRDCLTASLQTTTAAGEGLRVRLRLSDCPELGDVPWEFLYDAQRRRFLVLSEWTPLVRYLELPGAVRPLEVAWPLRMLVMISSPTDYEPLDVDGEWSKLQQSLGHLVADDKVVLERVPPTLSALRKHLRRADWHLLHFIGHGGFDDLAGDGVIVLETPEGRGAPVTGQDLGQMLCDHRALRLVVLNACEGARADRRDPFAGTAQSLILQGVPAVVAMQFEITDTAAVTFAEELYEAVADGFPLDAAVAEARAAVFAARSSSVEWATPVLYLRSPDGRVFDLTDTPAPVSQQPAPAPVEEVTAANPSTPGPVPADRRDHVEQPTGELDRQGHADRHVYSTGAPPRASHTAGIDATHAVNPRHRTWPRALVAAALVVAVCIGAAAFILIARQNQPAAPAQTAPGNDEVPDAADEAAEARPAQGADEDGPAGAQPLSSADESTGDDVPAPDPQPTRLPVAAVTALSVAPPGVDAAGRQVTYVPENLTDGDPTTAWRTPGDGEGELILLELTAPARVQRIGLIPGYAKIDPTDGTDRFSENRIVTAVHYRFDDGTAVRASFNRQPSLQFETVDVVTRTVTVEIASTTAHGGRDFTPISEIEIYGVDG